MARMSQWWKQNVRYVDMHGNNGSMDGDSPAAMRYTEARLSKISNELLKDIDKDTIRWAPNFDDTELEPTVLPAKYPNLLVNGSTGISAGYATNIPPHNLGEVIDAAIKRIDSPNCRLETISDIMKGPDFPTGGTAEGKKGIIDAFTTGRGKVIIKSKYRIEKNSIIIDEIPYEVNKATMVKKMDDIRIDKKIDGIAEVRDESDREGLRIAIDLKKGANKELIVNYLLKNTEMQIAYNYNMVTIVNRCPKTLGVLAILDAYIAHQREVITNRTNFDLKTAKHEKHIIDGLIKAISVLDEVIRIIRGSKNKGDAKNNLIEAYAFTQTQAEAIVTLQLYRLSNTDISTLEERLAKLNLAVRALEAILADSDKLKMVMKSELKEIKKEYATPRKTIIKDEITEIKIDTTELITKEDVIVVVTDEGYVKRVSKRSYDEEADTELKDTDFITGLYEMNTLDTLIMFTNLGNYLYIPVYLLPDIKWKQIGKHVSNIVRIRPNENIIASVPVKDFKNQIVTSFTKNGMVKRTNLEDFKVTRYSKPMVSMKLKGDDEVISVNVSNDSNIFIATNLGYGLWYSTNEVPVAGIKASGVKSIKLKEDHVVSGIVFNNEDYVTVITKKNTAKRIKLDEFEKTSRARRGLLIVREVKTNPYYIRKVLITASKKQLVIRTDEEQLTKITSFPIANRYSTGSLITKEKINNIYLKQTLREPIFEIEEINLEEVDDQIHVIDSLLDGIE
jgi:topoisomerase-4 subunit A